MSPELPEGFWQTVRDEAARLAPGPPRKLRAVLARMVEGFASPGREGRYLQDPRALAAYLRAFLPYEAMKLPYVLSQAGGAWRRDRTVLRIADCGSGPASATLGALAFLGSGARVEVALCDRERSALEVGRRLVLDLAARLSASATVTIYHGHHGHHGLFPPRDGKTWDLLVLQNALSEAFADPGAAAAALEGQLSCLAPDGILALLEPADRARSRFLLSIRDRAIAGGALSVLAPCTRQGPCPALGSARDWCSMESPISLTRAQRLDLREGLLDRNALKESYLVLSRRRPVEDASLHRVVGDVRRGNGICEAFVCGPPGRFLARLPRSHQSAANKVFLRLRRGDLAHLEGCVEKDGLALLAAQTHVRPASIVE
ncbi:MAG: small ribosomal subunit Rsm22 family protein [Acidobacteriota bacterium]